MFDARLFYDDIFLMPDLAGARGRKTGSDDLTRKLLEEYADRIVRDCVMSFANCLAKSVSFGVRSAPFSAHSVTEARTTEQY